MRFLDTGLAGSYVIELEKSEDERGFFARSFCEKEFAENGLCSSFVQCNVSFNSHKNTLRGMHYQISPHEEIKLVRCTRGSIYDVIVDLRPKSPTYLKHFGLHLNCLNHKMLYIPQGFAHGFLTLENESEVFYQMSHFFHPECARGLRWNDPLLDIRWPAKIQTISEKDKNYSDLQR
jgi:dTDP-4-dehydrorhamnose 3,5-epimerase